VAFKCHSLGGGLKRLAYCLLLYRVQQKTMSQSCLPFSYQPLGILTRNFTHLMLVHNCMKTKRHLIFSYCCAVTEFFGETWDIMVLHFQKFQKLCLMRIENNCCRCRWWRKSDVNFINKVCRLLSAYYCIYWQFVVTARQVLAENEICRWTQADAAISENLPQD